MSWYIFLYMYIFPVGLLTVCHAQSAMLVYKWLHRSVTVATLTSYWFQSDIIRMPFCQSTKHNSWLFPCCYGNRSVLSSHNSRGAWHTVYEMLLLNYKWDECMPCSSWIISEMLPEIHTVEISDFLQSIIQSQIILFLVIHYFFWVLAN